MATQDSPYEIGSTYVASADLSAKQYCGVAQSGERTVAAVAASTTRSLGVLQNKPLQGEPARIAVFGIVKAKAGAAFAQGAELMFDGSGRVITAATTNNVIVGKAVEAANNANEIISIFWYAGRQALVP